MKQRDEQSMQLLQEAATLVPKQSEADKGSAPVIDEPMSGASCLLESVENKLVSRMVDLPARTAAYEPEREICLGVKGPNGTLVQTRSKQQLIQRANGNGEEYTTPSLPVWETVEQLRSKSLQADEKQYIDGKEHTAKGLSIDEMAAELDALSKTLHEQADEVSSVRDGALEEKLCEQSTSSAAGLKDMPQAPCLPVWESTQGSLCEMQENFDAQMEQVLREGALLELPPRPSLPSWESTDEQQDIGGECKVVSASEESASLPVQESDGTRHTIQFDFSSLSNLFKQTENEGDVHKEPETGHKPILAVCEVSVDKEKGSRQRREEMREIVQQNLFSETSYEYESEDCKKKPSKPRSSEKIESLDEALLDLQQPQADTDPPVQREQKKSFWSWLKNE